MKLPVCLVGGQQIQLQGLLFDKDGTLLDFMALWGEWAMAVTDLLSEQVTQEGSKLLVPPYRLLGLLPGADGKAAGYDPGGPLAMAAEDQIRAILAWQLYVAGVAWSEAVVRVSRLLETAMEGVRQRKSAQPMPGLLPLLKHSSTLGLKLGVVTADLTSEAHNHLEWMGIRDYFPVCIGTDQVSAGKPDPEMVLLACRKLGLSPEQVAVIGDSEGDMQMGRRAGVALTIGYAPSGDASHFEQADQVITSFDEIVLEG